MAKTAYVNVRVDEDIKLQTEAILDQLGINMSTAIDIFLSQIILNDGLPFDVKIPKKDLTAFQEALAKAANMRLGEPYPQWFNRIVTVYAKGDIDFDTAVYAVKKQFLNG